MSDAGRRGPRALRLIRLGSRELERDAELAHSVRSLLDALQRRAPVASSHEQPERWIVAFDAASCAPASVHLARLAQESADPSVPDRAVQRALEALQRDVRRRWSVQSLAKAVGLSRAAFARRFTQALGVGPIAYLTELRLALAAERLREQDESLAQVAREVGYESEFAFSRAFKRRFGVPPASYRRLRPGSAPVCLALAA
jgi:AraC-like DNA-binding protein